MRCADGNDLCVSVRLWESRFPQMGKRGVGGDRLLAINAHSVDDGQALCSGTALDKKTAWHAIAWRLNDCEDLADGASACKLLVWSTDGGRPFCTTRRA